MPRQNANVHFPVPKVLWKSHIRTLGSGILFRWPGSFFTLVLVAGSLITLLQTYNTKGGWGESKVITKTGRSSAYYILHVLALCFFYTNFRNGDARCKRPSLFPKTTPENEGEANSAENISQRHIAKCHRISRNIKTAIVKHRQRTNYNYEGRLGLLNIRDHQ